MCAELLVELTFMADKPQEDDQSEMWNLVAEIDEQIEVIRSRLWQGHYDEEIEQTLHEVHERASSLNHLPLQTQALRLLGSLAYMVMNLEQAREYTNKALALALRLQDTAEMLMLGARLGFSYRAQGQPEIALEKLQPFVDKLDLIEVTPHLVRSAVSVLLRYIICLLLVHDYERAEKRLQQVDLLMERYDTRQYPAEAVAFIALLAYSWATVHYDREDHETAHEYCVAFDFATRKLGRQEDVVLVNMLYLREELLTDQPDEQKELAWKNMLVTAQPFIVEPPHQATLHHIAQYGFLEEADYYAVHGQPNWGRRFAEQALYIFKRMEQEEMVAKTLAFLADLNKDQGTTSERSP